MKQNIPAPFNHTTKDAKCDFTGKLAKELIKYQNGKLVVSMQIGLYDICFYLQLMGYERNFDELMPAFYTCKKVNNLAKSIGEKIRHHLEKDHRMLPIDDLIDGKSRHGFRDTAHEIRRRVHFTI